MIFPTALFLPAAPPHDTKRPQAVGSLPRRRVANSYGAGGQIDLWSRGLAVRLPDRAGSDILKGPVTVPANGRAAARFHAGEAAKPRLLAIRRDGYQKRALWASTIAVIIARDTGVSAVGQVLVGHQPDHHQRGCVVLNFCSPIATDAISNFLELRASDLAEPWNWYRFLTYGFVHGDVMHLLLNMISLYFLGRRSRSVRALGIFAILLADDHRFLAWYLDCCAW